MKQEKQSMNWPKELGMPGPELFGSTKKWCQWFVNSYVPNLPRSEQILFAQMKGKISDFLLWKAYSIGKLRPEAVEPFKDFCLRVYKVKI